MAEVICLKSTDKTKTISQIADGIKNELLGESVCDKRKLNDKAIMLCFEEFYFRCKSYVSLSIMLVENEDCLEAIVVGSGGGDGLLNISWGANKSFAKRAGIQLQKYGFVET